MTEHKKKYQYTYNYPEQRAMCKGLGASEKKIIADKLGYSVEHVYAVCNGKRRMLPRMEKITKEVLSLKKQMQSIKVSR